MVDYTQKFMYNTKTLLREELALNNNKLLLLLLLLEYSLLMI